MSDVNQPINVRGGPDVTGKWIITERCGVCGSVCGGDRFEAERELLSFLRDKWTCMALRGGESALRRLSGRGPDIERTMLAAAARTLKELLARIAALAGPATEGTEP